MWNDKQVKSFPCKEKSYFIVEKTNQRGQGRLTLEVHPNTNRYFYYQYFRDGKRKYVMIGKYKQSAKEPGYTLSEARDQALVYSDIHKQGFDVKRYLADQKLQEDARIKELEDRKRQGNFEQLMDSYLDAMETQGKRSVYYVRKALDRYVRKPYPEIIRLKANEVSSKQIGVIIRRMLNKGITTQTNRLRSYLHTAFEHGIKQDNDPRRYASEGIMFNLLVNPVSSIPRQADFEKVGEHVISEEEIKTIWNELPEKSPMVARVIKLAFATGQRVGEIVKLKLEHFNIEEETMLIPSTISKNGIDHLVPLNDLALSVVQEALNESEEGFEYAFPGMRGRKLKGDININNTTVANIVKNFCVENSDVSKFIPRDIRRTVKTLAAKAGISKELRDRIQNHALTDVSSKHYDRYDYMKEKREGLQVWNSYLNRIIISSS
jgi:integrase